MDPFTALTALGPLVVDLGKGLVNRFITPKDFKPMNIDEYARMKQIDLDLFKAMNDQGGGTGYQWAETIIKMQRPTVAFVVLGVWVYCILSGVENHESIDNFAAAIFFYLFGDRTLTYTRKSK